MVRYEKLDEIFCYYFKYLYFNSYLLTSLPLSYFTAVTTPLSLATIGAPDLRVYPLEYSGYSLYTEHINIAL